MASRRPTLAQVALHAGVSKAQASNALNGRGRVSEESRRRVIDAAEQLGYQQNAAATSLKRGSAPMIACHLDSRALAPSGGLYPFWRRLVTGMLEAAAVRGYHVILDISDDNSRLVGAPAEAVISITDEIRSTYGQDDDTRDSGHHVLTGDELKLDSARSTYHSDYTVASERITKLFMDAGCRRVAILRRPGEHPEVDFIVGAVTESLQSRGVVCSITQPDGSKERVGEIVRDEITQDSDGFLNFADQLPSLLDAVAAANRQVATQASEGIIVANQADTSNNLTNVSNVFFIAFDGHSTGRRIADHVMSVLAGDNPPPITFVPEIRRFADPKDFERDAYGKA